MSSTEAYITHQLNSSKTKETHIFPKSQRFTNSSKLNTQVIYNLPSTNSKRSTSFGLGNKMSLANKTCSPPPGSYQLSSDFQRKDLASFASIGQGRQKALKKCKNNPSPDRYNVQGYYSKVGGNMGERINTQIGTRYKRSLPGPGTYKLEATDMKTTGHYVLSTFKNYSSPRLVEAKTAERLAKHRRINTSISYDIQQKQVGRFASSKYKNVVTRTFSKSKRPGLEDKSKMFVPGYKYRRFSEFGGKLI